MTHPILFAGHRLSLAWLSLACVAVAYWEPTSLMHANLVQGGTLAATVMACIVFLAAGALLDVVANDIPYQPRIEWLLRHRATAYMVQAMANLAFVFALLKPGGWSWVAGIYFVLAIGSIWVAGVDTIHAVTDRQANV